MNDAFCLANYLNQSVTDIIRSALKAAGKNPKEWVFLWGALLSSRKAERIRSRHEKEGRRIPPFLIASITASCNLFCKGCYARANRSCGEENPKTLPCAKWEDIFSQAREAGVAFILLAGGEPLLRRDVIERAGKCKGVLFPVFTNGTMLDDGYIRLFDRSRNLVPILSMEGDRAQTDRRRSEGIYDIVTGAMERLKKRGLFYGVSVTVTTENLGTVTGADFIGRLAEMGCRVVFFVEYVPVDPSGRHLALGEKDRLTLEEGLCLLRGRYRDMLFLSFPGDEKYTGGCLAAGRGFFHINAEGSAEPCPFSPYSDINVRDHTLLECLDSPLFRKLESSGMLTGEHDGGCTLFGKEEEVRRLINPL